VTAHRRHAGTPGRALGDDDARRLRLIEIATAAIALYLLATACASAIAGDHAWAVGALALAMLAATECGLARRGYRAAAEWMTAGLIAIGSVVLFVMHGPMSSQLGELQLGIVFLGLTGRRWMAPAQAALVIGCLFGALATGLPIPMAPSTLPTWLRTVRQIALCTTLMMLFTHGYHRLLARLVHRTGELDAAYAELVAARDRLERLVAKRSAALERATADLETFTLVVSHDLRAPLRRVRSFLALFAEDCQLGEARLMRITAAQHATAELLANLEAVLTSSYQPAASGAPGA
jgi:signal transduction histidine kinase